MVSNEVEEEGIDEVQSSDDEEMPPSPPASSLALKPSEPKLKKKRASSAAAASSSSSSSAPPKPRVKKAVVEYSDSDSGSDYTDDGDSSDSSDSDSDVDDEIGVDDQRVHHEVQADATRDENVEPKYERQGGIGTRGTVRIHSTADYDPKPFTGLPLGFKSKNIPRHYDKLSIVGRLRIDIKESELDYLKRNKALNIKTITSRARDEIRLMMYAALSCQIETAFNIERGRIGHAPTVIPDEATNETMHIYYRCPMGRV